MRIVLATIGSLGDLHPFLALGLELQRRGHAPILATHECYRRKVEAMGLGFHRVRPDYDPTDREGNRRAMHRWKGSAYIVGELVGALPDTYADVKQAIDGADMLISQTTILPGPMLAEQTGIPWVSAVLAPAILASVYDPPGGAPFHWMDRLMTAKPEIARAGLGLLWKITAWMCEPVRQFRRQLGLGPGAHPLFEGQHSPALSLAMFSSAFAPPQPDWPESMVQTGFAFYGSDSGGSLNPELAAFLDEGGAPVVFTLGSAAVIDPGPFYLRSFEAAVRMGCRAVMLTGANTGIPATRDIFVTPYAPFEQLFARAAAVVHQGGIGTTAQALRAGAPALVVPFSHDQPDNAARVVRLGAGRTLSRRRYTADNARLELGMLLGSSSYSEAAESIRSVIKTEDGASAAADAILRQWEFHDS